MSNTTNGTVNREVYKPLCLHMVSTGKSPALIACSLWLAVALFAAAALFVPWQQSISGIGQVIIFSPMKRPQNIEAQIPARIMSWNVQDGQTVREGELVAELADLDPKFLDSMQPARLMQQRRALQARQLAAKQRLAALERQFGQLRRSQFAAVPSAAERTKQTTDRIAQSEQSLIAAKQNALIASLNLKRIDDLYAKGLRSKRDLELAEFESARAGTEVERALAAVEIAKRDQVVAGLDQSKIQADTEAAINNVAATIAQVQETIESTNSDIAKLDIDIGNLNSRVSQRKVIAPCSGKIVRLLKVGAGTTVDAGSVLAVIAPETEDLAVELLVSDNDAPLVSVGRPVRLQFAGWPALQFAGWPSIAVGTFGGRVAVVDAVDNGKNSYRVIVKPDWESIKAGRDEPWPKASFLRPGAEASGWIMLDTVSLGFELWRQFNAFPPTVNAEELGLANSASQEKKNAVDVKRKSK